MVILAILLISVIASAQDGQTLEDCQEQVVRCEEVIDKADGLIQEQRALIQTQDNAIKKAHEIIDKEHEQVISLERDNKRWYRNPAVTIPSSILLGVLTGIWLF